jgi:hypothetical protein
MSMSVQLGDTRVELSRPIPSRPDVIVVMTDDGRRAILGDGRDFVFAADLEALCEAMSRSRAARVR